MEIQSTWSIFDTEVKLFFPAPTSGAWNVDQMHLSRHRVNTMDSLCDLCASSAAGGE